MKAITQQFEIAMLEKLAEKGMCGKMIEDAAYGLLHVMVKPDIGQIHSLEYFVNSEIETHPAPWHDIWWIQLLRWIEKRLSYLNAKTKKHWHLPFWLIQLIYAQHINVTYRKEIFSKDTLERIQVMRHYLLFRGVQPSKVLLGLRAWSNLQHQHGYNPNDCLHFQFLNGQIHVCGLPIQINPFLAEDAVLVC